ncbi:aminotransferase class I/II-fold pyridoxal phosphate-dependent enzyme [Streptomyces sp. NPDC021622]|uniref:aminotransferase class I/II-fold pyridoxal phosphate-dependent enzyme n=1 Tax=Streptomyces sp. NPDC021622 TaxID=3155013 RepID=UPI003408390D
MSLDHSRAPVLEAVDAFRRKGMLSFSPPGHKQGLGVDPEVRRILGASVFEHDLLASGGLDDRRMRGQYLQEAERLMADAVHADHTFFTTCGSSLSVKAAMLSVAGPEQQLLLGRDAHKSVVSALILSGIEPVWVEPRWDPERHLAHPPSAQDFAEAFAAHPNARGALVTSPTPYGSAADLRGIAEICHQHGRPLIVDEAWGAHLPFHQDLPTWAMDAGADVCVTSIHKMGTGLEQGSVFHLQGDLVEPEVLQNRADLMGTTSPSVLVYAALDGWRRQMALHGHELVSHALETAAELRVGIEKIDGLHVNDAADFCGPGLADSLDPLPVVIDLAGPKLSGYRVADWLREQRSINVHLADHRRINVQITHADSPATTAPLLDALRDLARTAHSWDEASVVAVPPPAELRMEQACLPRDAFFAATDDVPISEAAGRVAAEAVTPYPPGIPVILPGERLTEPVLTYLRTGVRAGMNLPDAADPDFRTVRVVR